MNDLPVWFGVTVADRCGLNLRDIDCYSPLPCLMHHHATRQWYLYPLTAVLLGCVASRRVIGWRLCPSNSTSATYDSCCVSDACRWHCYRLDFPRWPAWRHVDCYSLPAVHRTTSAITPRENHWDEYRFSRPLALAVDTMAELRRRQRYRSVKTSFVCRRRKRVRDDRPLIGYWRWPHSMR